MCCSAFDVWFDLAESVRISAGFYGVYSFKPTGSRKLSCKGRLSITGSEIQIIK
jgi:Asp-tRNA(Asn)/Glu-tRNA(Gln) amidotransferase A subunit family amidase